MTTAGFTLVRSQYVEAADEAMQEAERAAGMWPAFNSAHEGFAVLAEEVDELKEAAGLSQIATGLDRLWFHVKTNQKRRDLAAMRAEAIQVAAMAIRFAAEVCDEERGRK